LAASVKGDLEKLGGTVGKKVDKNTAAVISDEGKTFRVASGPL
jgi:hypothetical protein